jgi:hypothetical protein
MATINRSSNLIFSGQAGISQPFDYTNLSRVREPVSRSKSGVQGKVADVFHGRSRHAESQNELNAFRILAATAHADAWQEQPFSIEYHADDSKQRYTPDVLIVWGSHREVIEIKEDRDAGAAENEERFRLISELLAEHGYGFRFWKRSEIYAEPRLTNVNLVLRYRRTNVPAREKESIRQLFCGTRDCRLGALRNKPGMTVQSILRLILDGTLHIDWWQRLGWDSMVSAVPIGCQLFPSRPTSA